jgi:fatty-acyl-CoA synthase
MSWPSFFNKISLNEPGKLALIDEATGTRWSYRKLRLEIDRWACFFQKNGVQKGDRIALLALNRVEHISLLLASAQIGAIFVPLNWRLSSNELQKIVDRVDPFFLITVGDSELKSHGLSIDLSIWLLPSDYKFESVSTSKMDPLLMLFTSGTSGVPKGVLFHGEMLEANQWATVKEWGLKKDDITVVETPFFHTGGYNVLLLPLLLIGGTIILSNGFDPKGTLELIEREKITVYFAVPTMFQRLSESKYFNKVDLSSLRFLISGGAPCPKELIHSYQDKNLSFRQGFGMTEVGPNCFSLEGEKALSKMGSVGKPMKHTKTMVLKENGDFAKIGEIGELLLKGPHVCIGYFNEETRFKDSFYKGFFKTGDLVNFD